jgi:hypothetical protein
MLIDQWLLESISIASIMSDSFQSILLPEAQVTNSEDNIAEIRYGKYISYITGITDYALWSIRWKELGSMFHNRKHPLTNFDLYLRSGC